MDGATCIPSSPDADAQTVDDAMPSLDAGPDTAPPDADVAYRALTPQYPRVRSHGGPILSAVRARIYVAPADPLKPQLEAFTSSIVHSTWWTNAVGEYCSAPGTCIGPGTYEGSFDLPAPAGASFAEADIRATIEADIANAAVREPDAESLYMFFIPSGTGFVSPFGSPACNGFHAYHYFVSVASRAGTPVRVPYAVMLRCADSSTLDAQTFLASHEIAEAATNPFMNGFVVEDNGWAATHGGEVADACLYSGTAMSGAFGVERVYSDRRAALGLDPCGLDGDGVDFNTVPADSQTRVVARPGESVTVDFIAESAAPTDGWTVQATSLVSGVTVGLGSSTANNGAHLQLTVTAAATLPLTYGGAFVIRSSRAGVTHAWQGSVQALYE